MPLISIVIPTHNRARLALEAIRSIQAQTHQSWELWIVDDHSTDHTKQLIEAAAGNDSRIHCLSAPENARGASSARNHGLHHANGEWIIFFDDDDLFYPFAIENRLKFAHANPRTEVFFFPCDYFNEQAGDMPGEKPCRLTLKNLLTNQRGLQTGSAFWKIAAISGIGGWDSSLHMWQDVDTHIRACMNLDWEVCQEMPADHAVRIGTHSSISRHGFHSAEKTESRLTVLKKLLGETHISPEDREALKSAFILLLSQMIRSRRWNQFEETVRTMASANLIRGVETLKLRAAESAAKARLPFAHRMALHAIRQ